MSDPQAALFQASDLDLFLQDHTKLQQGLDFASFHSPADILAPHPDLFELELDSSLAGFDEAELQLSIVDSNDAFAFLRSDTPTRGPLSNITASSDSLSAYESLSAHSESFYNYPISPYAQTNYSFPIDLEMDFQRINVDSASDYAGGRMRASVPNVMQGTVDPASFGTLPPTPPTSPPVQEGQYGQRGAFSDYGAPTRTAPSVDYYSQYAGALAQSTVSPSSTSSHLPAAAASIPAARIPRDSSEESTDGKKKYKCPSCPRSFARAYNLKTHVGTHDMNRLKPHVCPHRACGRSFSRKHDLGRHLISIHQEKSVADSQHSASSKLSIGVEAGVRRWCDACGKGFVGEDKDCTCDAK